MKYEVEFKPKSIKDLRKIDKNDQKVIIEKIEKMSHNLSGDIKKLTNYTPEYRLRVGNYRILFEVEDGKIIIYTIRHRKESYK
jgi:mRNA interferase RelE/StbE